MSEKKSRKRKTSISNDIGEKKLDVEKKDEFASYWEAKVDSVVSAELKDGRNRRKNSICFTLPTLGECSYLPGLRNSFELNVDSIVNPDSVNWNETLVENFKKEIGNSEAINHMEASSFLTIISRYVDLSAITSSSDTYRTVYCAHILSHLIRSKNLIINNKRKMDIASALGGVSEEFVESSRDQGFVRPSVLIMCPYKKDAYDVVNRLRRLIYGDENGDVWNKSRFEEEYSGPEEAAALWANVPEDHKELLIGNNDDTFRLGLALSKKTLKLYEKFDKSDILLCSPLGLRMILNGDEGNEAHLLSSIQLVVVDRADLMLQQNWEHVQLIFSHLNNLPAKIDMDISRVRRVYLEGNGRHFSQLMLFSRYAHELFTALVLENSTNHRGVALNTPKQAGTLEKIEVPLCQELHSFNVPNPEHVSEERWKYFCDKIVPGLVPRTCIVVPSYFDFVRMRNYLKKAEESFVACHEYAPKKKVLRARDMFYHERKSYLLVTERFYFFNRRPLRGIRRLIFYQIPSHPALYSEFINMSESSDSKRFLAILLYCKLDRIRLQNTFGTEMAAGILASPQKVQAIVSE
ncbi:unnamed protein product [Caenorhabditis auriculariae]|uniref:U3 small nucleolar RNA-associated protein 25 homolog n=1 Tax=Caenorhabditis auriculariae TaxID=2777116 RepID=A0A8S1HS54_9PELO|nr:unnamed protein product [Caenorhabditis auriculariae]